MKVHELINRLHAEDPHAEVVVNDFPDEEGEVRVGQIQRGFHILVPCPNGYQAPVFYEDGTEVLDPREVDGTVLDVSQYGSLSAVKLT